MKYPPYKTVLNLQNNSGECVTLWRYKTSNIKALIKQCIDFINSGTLDMYLEKGFKPMTARDEMIINEARKK